MTIVAVWSSERDPHAGPVPVGGRELQSDPSLIYITHEKPILGKKWQRKRKK
jgi:hypothetical protein